MREAEDRVVKVAAKGEMEERGREVVALLIFFLNNGTLRERGGGEGRLRGR